MSRGNESIDAVQGRPDAEELPVYQSGAFQVLVGAGGQEEGPGAGAPTRSAAPLSEAQQRAFSKVKALNHDLLKSVTTASALPRCSVYYPGTTLLISRVEYANWFHATTELFGAFAAAKAGGTLGPPRIILADGHCRSPVDAAWEVLSSELKFLKQLLPETQGEQGGAAAPKALAGNGRGGGSRDIAHTSASAEPAACFERLLLAPGGYQSAISTGINPLKACSAAPGVLDFAATMRSLMGVHERQGGACSGNTLRVLFVRRENYKAHPRQRGSIVKRLANEAEVYDALRNMARDVQDVHAGVAVDIVSGEFSRMSLAQQMQHAHDACVIVGAHGAGLSHVLFAQQGVRLLEVVTPGFVRPHFRAYAEWAGARYKALTAGSNSPNPSLIVAEVRSMLEEAIKEHA